MARTTTTTRSRKKKHCPKCERDLSLDAFGKDKNAKDGKYRICKECDRAEQKAWRERQKAKKAAEQQSK